MSTAPIIAPELPATWAGQLPELLKKYRNFGTRAEAQGDLVRMARLAALHVADHPATDGYHTSVEELLRASLQAYLSEDIRSAFSRLRHIAELADTVEIGGTA
jgi:hypothetical protein